MADYSILKAAIAAYVKDRTGLDTIDGDGLQETLLAMVNSLGAGYQFADVAKLTPTQTDPGTPDQNVFYIATEAGTYTNFPIPGGYLQVADGEVAIFKYNGSWSKEVTGIPMVSVSQNTSTGHTDIKVGGIENSVPTADNVDNSFGNGYYSQEIVMTPGGYIQTNGTTVDVTDVHTMASAKYAVINCSQGDVFLISGSGGSAGRLWAFIDSGNNVLDFATENVTEDKLRLIAPPKAVKLVINTFNSTAKSYVGRMVSVIDDYRQKHAALAAGFIGSKLSVIGDSISTYNQKGFQYSGYPYYYPNGGVSSVSMTYLGMLMELTGIKLDVNASYAGSYAVKNSASVPSFYERVSLLGSPDTIIVALGTNDSFNNKDIGEINYDTEISSLGETQFGNAYLKGIKGLLAAYPNAKIICVIFEMGDAYANVIKKIAQHYSIDFRDLRGYKYGVDSGGNNLYPHPGADGMKDIVSKFINSSIDHSVEIENLDEKLINIVGIGTVGGGDTGVTGNGQYFIYQTTGDLAKSKDYTDSSHFNYDVVDWRKDAIYIYGGNLQVWNGSELVDKTPTTPDIINPNSQTGTPSYDYLYQAAAAVPVQIRKKGLIMTYFDGTYWNILQFRGNDVSEWGVGNNWTLFSGMTKAQYENIVRSLSVIGITIIPITENGYITTNGSTVDTTTISGGAAWKHIVLECEEGDRFTIHGSSGSAPRLWCFIDSGNNVLSVAPANESGTKYITAPENSVKLVINVQESQDYWMCNNFSEEKAQDDLYATKKKVDDAIFTLSECEAISGYVGTDGKWGYVGNSGTLAYLIPVNGGDGVKIAAPSSADAQYYAFLRSRPANISNGSVADISHEDGFTKAFAMYSGPNSYKVPSDAKYLLVSATINGSNRLPSSIVVNFYDVVSGKNTQDAIFGGFSGDFTTGLSKASKLICTIIDDDAQTTLSMNALEEVMNNLGLKCTIASLADKWDSENEGEPFYDADLKQKLYDMELEGFQIVLHGYKQDGNNTWLDIEDSDANKAKYEANFVKGLRLLHQAGFANCDFWVTPSGVGSATPQMFARKYGMKALIMTTNGINLPYALNTISGKQTGNLETWDNTRWRIRRGTLNDADDSNWTLQNLKDLAERGSHHGAWLVLCTHSYEWASDATRKAAFQSRMSELKTYVENLGYEFMTLGEAWTYKKPIYDAYDLM